MFDQIEKLKTELTDKYVLVDETIPELARFEGHVGQVKTVNMNGRALVQFDTWNNIGWYDIEVDCLRVVPKPDPAATAAKGHDAKKEAPRAAAKPAAAAAAPGEKKLSPLEMARMQGAAKGGAAPAKAAAPAKDKPAAAKPAAPAAGGKKSVADILAAARANKPAGGAPAASAAAPAAAEPVEEPAAEAAPAPVAAKPAGKTTLKPGQRPSVPEILAWCREHDTK
jgi:hypothetical protein